MYVCMCIYIYIYMYVCICVCVAYVCILYINRKSLLMACCLAHMKPTVVVITVSDIGSASCLVRRCAMGFS